MSATIRPLRACITKGINSSQLSRTSAKSQSLRIPVTGQRYHHRSHHAYSHSKASTGHRYTTSRHTALDPITFIVAAVASAGIAYLYTIYTADDRARLSDETETLPKAHLAADSAEVLAHDLHPDMATKLPGRPGSLTPDQEEKLKEMWMQTLEVFGVSPHESETHTNGTATPSSTATSDFEDKKKKRKSRMSLFGSKKNKETPEASTEDNDKHGQTAEFQRALSSQTPEQLRAAFWSMTKHDHPDALLLRFLRARKWDVHAALVMMVSTMHWRAQEMHVDDDIMLRGEGHAIRESKSSYAAEKKEGDDFMAQLRMGKSFLHGTDKDGRPCCYVRVRLHRQGEQSDRSLERFTVYTIETARMLLRPPVDTATIVFDMTDFSMANMDYTPVKFMIKCFEANYPESLGSVLVYKSPFIFSAIWKIIRGWLDPVVASKVHFCSNVHELEEWIPRSKIMKELGGDELYTYSYLEPSPNEDAQLLNTTTRDKAQEERTELVKSYESETLSWIHGEDSGEGRARLAQRLAENYWRLDPFIRAKSLYDRTGVIKDGGKVDFYPSSSVARTAGDGANDELD